MDNFSNKVQVFLDYFIHHDGYKTVLPVSYTHLRAHET